MMIAILRIHTLLAPGTGALVLPERCSSRACCSALPLDPQRTSRECQTWSAFAINCALSDSLALSLLTTCHRTRRRERRRAPAACSRRPLRATCGRITPSAVGDWDCREQEQKTRRQEPVRPRGPGG